MKRIVTVSFSTLAVLMLVTSIATAQLYTPVVSPQGITGYQFTGLPGDGDDPWDFRVTTIPPVGVQFANPDGTPNGITSPHIFNQPDGNLAIWIVPPPVPTTITVVVSYMVALEPVELVRGTQLVNPATTPKTPSLITLSSSANPAPYGDQVTFTVTITSSSGTGGPPTGTVTLTEGINVLGSGTLNGSGVATVAVEGLTVATAPPHSITASYGGDAAFEGNSTTLLQTINQRTVTVTNVSASNKTYDGNTSATLSFGSPSLLGVVGIETVTLNTVSAVGTFDNKNVGANKLVTVTGLSIGGADVANYVLSSAAVTTTASIEPKVLTVTGITANDKVYDGTTQASLNTGSAALVGVVTGEAVSLDAGSAVGNFGSKNIGTDKPVTVSGLTISGTGAGNYTLTQPTTSASITPATASVTPADVTKTLGSPDPPLTGTLTGFFASDNVIATYSRTPGETVAGSPYTISATLSPADVLGNYTITYNTGNFFITSPAPPELLVRFDVQEKDIVVVEVGTSTPVEPQTSTHGKKHKNRDVRTYRLTKPNGTWIEIVIDVKNEGHSCKAEIQSIAYSTTTTVTHPGNALKVEWATNKLGALKELEQKVELKHGLQVEAEYSAKKDRTNIEINQKGKENDLELTVPGVALIGLATDQGALRYDGPGSEVTVSSPTLSGHAKQVADEQVIEEIALPTEYALMQNYPNPFNPSTTIRFDLPEAAKVRLVVYDMLGREVAVLADGERPAGQHSVRFDAAKLTSGMYIYRLQTGQFTQTKKLMLVK